METLSLQGVRCFGERQDLPIRPVTLLVGENSTGKSTIVDPSRVSRYAVGTAGFTAEWWRNQLALTLRDVLRYPEPLSALDEPGHRELLTVAFQQEYERVLAAPALGMTLPETYLSVRADVIAYGAFLEADAGYHRRRATFYTLRAEEKRRHCAAVGSREQVMVDAAFYAGLAAGHTFRAAEIEADQGAVCGAREGSHTVLTSTAMGVTSDMGPGGDVACRRCGAATFVGAAPRAADREYAAQCAWCALLDPEREAASRALRAAGRPGLAYYAAQHFGERDPESTAAGAMLTLFSSPPHAWGPETRAAFSALCDFVSSAKRIAAKRKVADGGRW